MAVLPAAAALALYRRHHLDRAQLAATWMLLLAVVALCALRPHWFRGFYRRGMTLSHYVGQCMGRVLLTLFFLVILTPLGLFLRLLGKDLLAMKKPPATPATFWRPARPWGPLDRQF
jgi:hypothetical protein